MVLSRTRFKFVKIVVKAEKFGNGSFQGQRSACYVTVHRKSEKWAPRALSLTCDNMLVHCCSKDTGGFPDNDKKINLKHCNSPFLELSQTIKAKTFVLKPSKFRFPLLCLISQCTSISILHLEQRQNSVTQGQGHKKSHEQSLTHTGCQLNSEKLFFLCLVPLQTVWQGYRCTPIRQWIWTRNKIQIVLLITVMTSKMVQTRRYTW